MKIVLCGLTSDKNVGEHLVVDSCKWLYDRLIKEDNEFCCLDFYARTNSNTSKYINDAIFDLKIVKNVNSILKKCDKNLPALSGLINYCVWHLDKSNRNRYLKYYEQKIKGADLIIFAGGGVIEATSVHSYCFPIYEIVKIAERENIPVIFNAVGLVGKCKKFDLRSITMKKALNSRMVKMISVRDGIKEMNRNYLKYRKAYKVADTAVWSSQVYKIKKDEKANIIGLGVIRSDCYSDYNMKFYEEDLINLWCNIIKELESKNYKWKIFVNGLDVDYKVALKILNRLKIKNIDEYLCKKTSDGAEFVQMLSSFKAIVVHRLHSCIAAYSLGIPAIALSWNDKVDFFMNEIGYPNRSITLEKHNAKHIVNMLEQSMKEEYFDKKRYKNTVVRAAKHAVENIEK